MTTIDAPTTFGNGDLFVNSRILFNTSCSLLGNFMNSFTRLTIALQKSCCINIAVHLPVPNCTPVDLYVSPVANRHNANATRLCIGIDCRSLVSCLTISGSTKRTIQSNVCLDILNFFLHHSSTKALFKRLSNYN